MRYAIASGRNVCWTGVQADCKTPLLSGMRHGAEGVRISLSEAVSRFSERETSEKPKKLAR